MKTQEPSSEELFARIKRGDHAAFDVLYDRLSSKVYAYARTVLRDDTKAADIVQQVFMSVYSSRESFRGTNLEAWIFTIARNACLRQKRLDTRSLPLEDPDAVWHDEGGMSGVDVELVRSAIEALPEDDRVIIRLRYFDDLSYNDIAAMLGITLTLTKVRLFRARRKLAGLLMPLFKEE
jgi:RNA polymerase sigma-70 factor (ECF subfamily)